MNNFKVSIEKNGVLTAAGRLTGESHLSTCFKYDADYLASENAQPISVRLPLQSEPFSAEQTKLFFDGLLPEGYIRMSIADSMHFNPDDYVTVLHKLGCECLGAIMISDDEDHYTAAYESLSKKQLNDFAKEGASKSIELVSRSHLSLAGASGKAGLYYDKKHDRWYLPVGTAPSTHIVKQSHVRLDSLVLNEQLCMLTAGLCGLDVPNSVIINTADGGDEDILFATERYDRIIPDNHAENNGLPVPLRLHQEDFAQALGIPAADKYEKSGDNYLKLMFDLIRTKSSYPLEDMTKLWDRIVFSCLIGNADAHLKNYSILYESDLSSKRLAPVYDIVSTAIYTSSSRNLSVSIGDAETLDDLNMDAFRAASAAAGIGENYAVRRVCAMTEQLPKALSEAAASLASQGFPKALEIADRIKAESVMLKQK